SWSRPRRRTVARRKQQRETIAKIAALALHQGLHGNSRQNTVELQRQIPIFFRELAGKRIYHPPVDLQRVALQYSSGDGWIAAPAAKTRDGDGQGIARDTQTARPHLVSARQPAGQSV